MKNPRYVALGLRRPLVTKEQKRYFDAFAKLHGLRRPVAFRRLLDLQMEREPITQEEAA